MPIARIEGESATAGTPEVVKTQNGNLQTYNPYHVAGERNPESATASYTVAIPCGTPIRKDNFLTEVLVADYPCILLGYVLNSAHIGLVTLVDANATGGGATPIFRIGYPGVDSSGYHNTGFVAIGAEFYNGITADSDSANSDITFIVRAL